MKRISQILIAATFFFLFSLPPALSFCDPQAPPEPKRVLVLYSHFIGMPWDDLLNTGLNEVFADSGQKDIELYFEYLDLSRNPSDEYESALLRMIEVKYGNRQPDIIISNMDFTSDTILLPIIRTLSKSKIILMSNEPPSEKLDLVPGRISGFYAETVQRASPLTFIQKALPNVRHVYYIIGATAQEQEDLNQSKEVFEAFKSRFDFTYHAGLPIDELLERLQLIPKNSAIIFGTYFRDAEGTPYVPAEVLEQIHENAKAPIFGMVDTYLGRGIIGGKLSSAEQLGKEAAQHALDLLDHWETNENLGYRKASSAYIFDWRELKRWGIGERQLPENSIIRYRELSFFEIYKWHILLGACILVIESLLIAFLLVTLSKRKAAEKALSGSEKKYRRLVENLRDGIISIDKNMMVTGFNSGAMRIFGYRERDILGQSITTLMPQDEKKRQFENITEVMEQNIFSEYESTRLKRDGTPIPVRIIQSTLKNEADRIIGLVEIVRDISLQKQALQEKAELEIALQQAQKMEAIGTLAGGIAHDFNNILAAMIGFTEFVLLDVTPGSSMESSLQEVIKAGKRARDLVNQILTFARRNHETLKPIHVPPIAAEALKLIRSTIPAFIEIRQRLEAESPILADPVKIQQVFMNICVNAAQSMKNSGLLEVDVTDVPEKDVPFEERTNLPIKDYLKIRISDTGSGIPENTIDLIFEPYFTTKEVGDGSGLGLSVVHGIVKSYGGEIFVDSEVGQGTVFTIYFPITREQPREIQAKSFDLPKGSERILLVDDEPVIIKMMSQLLSHLGYSVTSRTDSAEALALFQKNPDGFDLVITDMTMPAICGDVLAREMNKIRPDIPVLLCTGYSKALSDEKPYGVSALIMKPVEQGELADVIRRLLDKKGGTGMKK